MTPPKRYLPEDTSMTFNRRTFLQTATAAAAVATTPTLTSTARAAAKRLPIIDTHQHLWDLDLFQPPWLGGAPDVLARSYVTSDYKKATRAVNLAKAVYMEVDVNPKNQVKEAEHLIALSKDPRHPTVAAVVSGRPGEESFAPYIKKFRDNTYIKGIRQVLHVDSAPQGLCLGEQYVKSVQLLGSLGKSFDLCMRPTELSDGASLADKAPDTRLIVDHCGNADPKAWIKNSEGEPWHEVDQWKRDIELLASKKNVICKISGIVARAPKDNWGPETLAPIINHCLDSFGPDRVIFGGDWPVCRLVASYKQWVDALKAVVADRPYDEQLKLFHDNAERLYDI
ncbi:MAG: amidohydrolase [Rhodopirellula sp.]|nr:amidohydrolase [Rhodopirellula sp.]